MKCSEDLEFPSDYIFSHRSPSKKEVRWLYEWLIENKSEYELKNLLEFSCGITSWVLCEALDPDRYIAVDKYKRLALFVKNNLPKVQLVEEWKVIDILPNKYDLILIDGSTCVPADIRIKGRGVYREEALKYSEKMLTDNALVIMHDWNNKRGGWRRLRNYLDGNYKFLAGCKIGFGFGIYQR